MRMRLMAPLAVALLTLLGSAKPASAQLCGASTYSCCSQPSCDAQCCFSSCQQQCRTCYKLVYDNVLEKRWQTCYQTVQETVMKQVCKTCYRDECKTCYKPCYQTCYKTVTRNAAARSISVLEGLPLHGLQAVLPHRVERSMRHGVQAGL